MSKPFRGGVCPHGIYRDTRCFICQPDTSPQGVVAVDVLLRVTADEMREWPPGIIDRFFAGIAMATDARREGQRHAQIAAQPLATAVSGAFQTDDSRTAD